jgi:hypothetical protein
VAYRPSNMRARSSESTPAGGSRTAAAGALVGAALLGAADASTLYSVHVASRHAAVFSITTGKHDSYGLVPIAVLLALLAVLALGTARARARGEAWVRTPGRGTAAAIAALGLAALLIALIGDLPDAHAQGVLRLAGRLVLARARPGLGFYLETLGAVVALLAGVWGLLLGRPVEDRAIDELLVAPSRR